MARWKWVDEHLSPPSGVDGQFTRNWNYTIQTGWALQRVIVHFPCGMYCNDGGSAIGNPVYATGQFFHTLVAQDNTSDQRTVMTRGVTVAPQSFSTVVAPTTLDRLATWTMPWDLWDYDINLRMESGSGAGLQFIFQAGSSLPGSYSNGLRATACFNMSGHVSLLLSQPG